MRFMPLLTTLVAGMLGLLIAACGSSGQATSPAPNIPTRNADKAPDVTDEELFDSGGTPRPESKPDDSDAGETLDLDDDTDLSEDDAEDEDDSDSEEEFDFDEYEDDED
jgi:hypothetical protein